MDRSHNALRIRFVDDAARVGVLHGCKSNLLETAEGQILPTHSISAGLDYPGVGPEHAYYQEIGRAQYVAVTDQEALKGFMLLSRTEGIIPALEPAHAIAYLLKLRSKAKRNALVILCLSGRGDKDMGIVKEKVKMPQ